MGGYYSAFTPGLLLNPFLAIVLAFVALSNTVFLRGCCICAWYGARVGELLDKVWARIDKCL